MNSGCIPLQCTDTGSCAYEHQIKGSGAPGMMLTLMKMFLCSDVIFLAGSWHEEQTGNTQQGRDYPGWCCFLRESRGVGVQRTMLRRSLLSCSAWTAKANKEQAQRPSWPAAALSLLQTGAGREKEPRRTAAPRATPRSGHPHLLLQLLPGCVILSWGDCSIAVTAGQVVHSQTHTQNSVQTNTSVSISLHSPLWDSIWWPVCPNNNWFKFNGFLFDFVWFFSHKDSFLWV